MQHSHSKIWIHLVWGTKKRERVLFEDQARQLFHYFVDKAPEIGIAFEKINIQPEHVHTLIDLPTNKTVSEIMQKIKGSSSYWLNQNIFQTKFEWQRGYGAYSVSASQLEKVKKYIANQAEHHRVTTFEEEYQAWKKQYGIVDE